MRVDPSRITCVDTPRTHLADCSECHSPAVERSGFAAAEAAAIDSISSAVPTASGVSLTVLGQTPLPARLSPALP